MRSLWIPGAGNQSVMIGKMFRCDFLGQVLVDELFIDCNNARRCGEVIANSLLDWMTTRVTN